MLVSMKSILQAAREGGYGVIAPNICNEDTARAAIAAAEANRAPLILDVGFSANPNIVQFGRMLEMFCQAASVPLAVNLDHGDSIKELAYAIRAGFTSVMADYSTLPLEENICAVQKWVEFAHPVGVDVEAELGHVGQGVTYDVDRNAGLTNPAEARTYVERTGVDFLAVAVGTAHGAYRGTPKIDFDRLHKLFDAVSVPLVMHGGSGTGDENLYKATHEGISKVNVGSDLFKAAADAFHEEECASAGPGYRVMKLGYQDRLTHYMGLTGQIGRA